MAQKISTIGGQAVLVHWRAGGFDSRDRMKSAFFTSTGSQNDALRKAKGVLGLTAKQITCLRRVDENGVDLPADSQDEG